ncbi:glycoside hydrolase superfamily [Mycena vulgaris]|nr:glycoside hydrolase superfamily [Mycena vulgaris]
MHPRSFFSVFFYISLAFALDSASWSSSLSSLLRQSSHKRINQHLDTRSIPTGWTSIGCVTDGTARALSYSYVSSILTQDSCISTCDTKGYSYGGLQYGDECWCGNSLANNQGVATAASDCNMPCAGNSAQICGASYRMSLFQKTTAVQDTVPTSGWTQTKACVVDTSARILQGSHVSSSSNTPASCQVTCAGQGFGIAGVQNGNECWCGSAIIGGIPSDAATSDCNVACAGDSLSKCGGSWRMQIYTAPASGTTTTTSSTTSSTTTTTTTTTTTSAATATSTSWALSSACVVDTSARILQGSHVSSSSNTPTSCQFTCAGQGFLFAGVQNGNECWCGSAIIGGTPGVALTSECNVACAGDSTSKCGGSWRMQLYTATVSTTTGTPTATTTSTTITTTSSTTTTSSAASLATGWALSRPCVVDTSARVLRGYSYSSQVLTPVACQLACAGKGLAIAGVQNGNECYCGNVFVGGAPADGASSDCNVPCAGASSLMCGGGYRMAIYTSTIASVGDFWQTTWDRAKQLTALNLSPINFTTFGASPGADITVDETTTYQTMDGFGGSLTDSSAKLLANMKTANTVNYYSLLHQLFDVSDGANSAMSSVLRLPLGATDFSDSLWTYCDSCDTSFSGFDINRTPAAVWTVLYDILAINPLIKIYVVPWSPPAWMKDGNSMLGGTIKADYVSYYYPLYLLKALQGLQSKGIALYSIALTNEPAYYDPASGYPTTNIPVETAATIGRALRTMMNNNGFSGVKILGWDHNFSGAAGYPVQLMQQAGDAFAGASFHCYGGTVNQIDNFRSAFPAKEVHITECSGVYGSDWWSDVKWYSDNMFIGGPDHYAKTSMMWNIALDPKGQPMLPGAKSCGTPCRGIVEINGGMYTFNQEFWPIAHAGKAIAPKDAGGAFGQRIGVTVGGTYSWALRVNAYATARQSSTSKTRYSLVVLNWRDYATSAWNPMPQTATINFRGVQATYTFPVGLTTLSWYA